jgi:hypothetical protein
VAASEAYGGAVTAQPAEPDPRPAEVLHIVPDLPGQDVPPGAVPVPVEDYDRVRRRAIAQLIREQNHRMAQGDFSDFTEVTAQEIAAGTLDG